MPVVIDPRLVVVQGRGSPWSVMELRVLEELFQGYGPVWSIIRGKSPSSENVLQVATEALLTGMCVRAEVVAERDSAA